MHAGGKKRVLRRPPIRADIQRIAHSRRAEGEPLDPLFPKGRAHSELVFKDGTVHRCGYPRHLPRTLVDRVNKMATRALACRVDVQERQKLKRDAYNKKSNARFVLHATGILRIYGKAVTELLDSYMSAAEPPVLGNEAAEARAEAKLAKVVAHFQQYQRFSAILKQFAASAWVDGDELRTAKIVIDPIGLPLPDRE